jgi:ABC-type amino acid transport substrate-binding protein
LSTGFGVMFDLATYSISGDDRRGQLLVAMNEASAVKTLPYEEQINRALLEIKSSGAYDEILNRWSISEDGD